MRLDLDHLPHDTALLHQLVRDLAARVEQRDGEIEKLRLIVRQLRRGSLVPGQSGSIRISCSLVLRTSTLISLMPRLANYRRLRPTKPIANTGRGAWLSPSTCRARR